MTSQLALFDDTLPPFVLPVPPPLSFPIFLQAREVEHRGIETVAGWCKTWPANPSAPTLYVLNFIPHDAHVYAPAVFWLADSVTVELWPASGCRGLKVKGEKEMISLHAAVERNLAGRVGE